MVAVYDNSASQWWLYYLSTAAQIKVIQGPKDGQLEDAENNPPYERRVVDVAALDIPKPKAGNSQLGVCEYVDTAGNPQVCILFRDILAMRRNVSVEGALLQTRVYLDSDDTLVELAWSKDRGWFKGALTNAEIEATPDSVVTAAVTKDQLKVYYRGKDKSG